MRIHINITGELLHQIDELIEKGTYGSRTEIVRDGIRRILENQRPREPLIMELLRKNREDRIDREDIKHD